MKNIKTCELCRDQIIKTEDFANLNCDEKQNLNILKNLEITVSSDAKICSNCVNISHLTYNFKTSCLSNNDHLKILIHPSVIDKLILEEVVVKKTKSDFKNEEKVCRFCLNFFEVNLLVEVNLEHDVVLKDMLERCLPEIDTYIVQNPLICYICSELLEKLFNFISHCEHTEVLGNFDTKTDRLVNENKPTVTVANNDNNINKSFLKKEHYEDLGDPELQIKSEDFHISEDVKDSINDSNCLLKEGEIHGKSSSFSLGLSHQRIHRKARKSTTSKLYKCTECLFQFQCQWNLVRHKKNCEKTYKCNVCGFMASNRCENVKHKNVHQNLGESELFKCDKCPYTTKFKRNLVRHNTRWHKDILKIPKYKCDECPYETLWKWLLVDHKVKHRDPSEITMYTCMECLFETKRKRSLRIHEKVHARNRQNAAKVEQNLSNLVEEKDVKPKLCGTIKEKKFVCDICSFQTTKKSTLKQHFLIHREPSEVNVFKCDYCPFATKWKNYLTSHTMRHKNPLELPKFKCNDCSYETNKRQSIVSHVLIHKKLVNMYQCKVCSYQTKNRSYIQRHEKRHQVETKKDDMEHKGRIARTRQHTR